MKTLSCEFVWDIVPGYDTCIVTCRLLVDCSLADGEGVCSKDIFSGFMPGGEIVPIVSTVNMPPRRHS